MNNSKKVNGKSSRRVYSRSDRAVTLFALIFTIIVLIILTGITIFSLNNSKLFSKATESTDKYKIAKQDEQNTLNEYNSYISNNSRETITIDKTEYEKIKLLNKPNLWEVGKEYDFGDNIYGKRIVGIISNKGRVYTKLFDFEDRYNYKIINYGGWWDRGCDNVQVSIIGYDVCAKSQIAVRQKEKDICLLTDTKFSDESLNYDVWVLYTKK